MSNIQARAPTEAVIPKYVQPKTILSLDVPSDLKRRRSVDGGKLAYNMNTLHVHGHWASIGSESAKLKKRLQTDRQTNRQTRG